MIINCTSWKFGIFWCRLF